MAILTPRFETSPMALKHVSLKKMCRSRPRLGLMDETYMVLYVWENLDKATTKSVKLLVHILWMVALQLGIII